MKIRRLGGWGQRAHTEPGFLLEMGLNTGRAWRCGGMAQSVCKEGPLGSKVGCRGRRGESGVREAQEEALVLTLAQSCLSPCGLFQDLPTNSGGPSFHKSVESFLPSALPLRPVSCLASRPIPIPPTCSIISDFRTFALAPSLPSALSCG